MNRRAGTRRRCSVAGPVLVQATEATARKPAYKIAEMTGRQVRLFSTKWVPAAGSAALRAFRDVFCRTARASRFFWGGVEKVVYETLALGVT